jgi:hypothetical protein
MRTIGKLVLGLAVAALFSGVIATSASAAPVWQTCTNLEAEIGNYGNLGCTIEKEGGKYEWLGNEESGEVQGTGTLRLSDTKTLAGKSEVECSVTTKGVVGPQQSGRVESITIASCKQLKVCENVETVKPLNLPWQTELTEKSDQVRDTIREVSGEPGWSVTCKTLLGSKTDTCLTETGKEGSTTATNETTHGYVLGEFGPTAKVDCTEGGKESGEVGGIVTTEGNGGAALKIGASFTITPRKGGNKIDKLMNTEEAELEIKAPPGGGEVYAISGTAKPIGSFTWSNTELAKCQMVYGNNAVCPTKPKVKDVAAGPSKVTFLLLSKIGGVKGAASAVIDGE